MKKIKLISIFAAISITASITSACASELNTETIVTAPELNNPFTDTYDKWYESAVTYVYTNGLIQGVSDSEFAPEKNVSRAELAAILYRLDAKEKNVPENIAGENEKWYEPAKKWAEENGVMNGLDGEFDAEKSLLREEIITMLYNSYKINHQTGDSSDMILSQFEDAAEVDDFAKEAVRWAVEKKIIQGDDLNKLNPKNNVTRGETAAIIERALENLAYEFNGSGEDGLDIENPMVEYASLEEAEKAAGYAFPKLDIKDFKADKFYVYNEADAANSIIEAIGTYGEKAVTIRTGLGDRDISGIYGGETFEGGLDGIVVTYGKLGDTVYADWAKAMDNEVYCYSVAIENGTADELNAFVNAIGAEQLTAPDPGVQIPNPMSEYKTLAEAEKASGLTMPELKIDGFTASVYYTIDEEDSLNAVLEEEGTYSGKKVTVRTGLGDRAISGIYGEEMDGGIDDINVSYGKYDTTVYAEWAKTIDGEIYCYSVAIENGTADELNIFVSAIGAENVEN